jgi:hypothetical protein
MACQDHVEAWYKLGASWSSFFPLHVNYRPPRLVRPLSFIFARRPCVLDCKVTYFLTDLSAVLLEGLSAIIHVRRSFGGADRYPLLLYGQKVIELLKVVPPLHY